MKIVNNVLLVVGLLFLVGCGPTYEEAKQQTQTSIQSPELISENTPKGKLWRISVSREGSTEPHYVYYFDGSTNTTTVNYNVQRGKTHYNQTIAIDGQEYILKPKE